MPVRVIVIGPFVFNFIGNILKFRSEITEDTTVEELERAILTGPDFSRVVSINVVSLTNLLQMLKSGSTIFDYMPSVVVNQVEPDKSELESLRDRKRRLETAQTRLTALFLYSDEAMSEDEYIKQKQKLAQDIEMLEERITALGGDQDSFDKTDYQFLDRASYFVLVQQLLDSKRIDYEKYIRNIDPYISKSFVRNTFSEVDVVNGDVTKMVFKNGLEIQFNYK